MEEKFKVTIEFSAIDYNKALETYNMMLEAFCNNIDSKLDSSQITNIG